MQSSTVNLLSSGRHEPQLAVARKLGAIVGEDLRPISVNRPHRAHHSDIFAHRQYLRVEVAPARTIEEEVRANP
jgi:DNA-binding XRE family transcriptional regulator